MLLYRSALSFINEFNVHTLNYLHVPQRDIASTLNNWPIYPPIAGILKNNKTCLFQKDSADKAGFRPSISTNISIHKKILV